MPILQISFDWVSRLAGAFPSLHIVNTGVNGATAADVLKVIVESDAYEPIKPCLAQLSARHNFVFNFKLTLAQSMLHAWMHCRRCQGI